jgi:hypothetical protein
LSIGQPWYESQVFIGFVVGTFTAIIYLSTDFKKDNHHHPYPVYSLLIKINQYSWYCYCDINKAIIDVIIVMYNTTHTQPRDDKYKVL